MSFLPPSVVRIRSVSSAMVCAAWFAAGPLVAACTSDGGESEESGAALTATTVVARDPLDLPAPITRTTPAVVEVELRAIETVADLGDGRATWVWTYNGTVPGPLLRVIEGDDVVVRFTNDDDNVEPHSLDLHAVVGPGGGDAVTTAEPGESRELRFKATRQGTFFYHCAAEGMPWEHVSYGMYGAIVVEPKGGLPAVDREIYVAQSEWYLHGSDDQDEAGGEGERSGGEHDAAEGAPDLIVLDENAAEEEHPRFFTLNGHLEALTSDELYGQTTRVVQGETLRIFFANAGPNLASSFHMVGGIFDRVYAGHFDDAVRNEETILVPPGSAIAAELTLPVPGKYALVDHALWRASRGAVAYVHVDADGAWPKDLYDPEPVPRAGGH